MFNVEKGRHYESGQWIDFARGLLSRNEREAMQAHLDAGCTPCNETAAFFSDVARRAKADAAYQVPAYAVQYARAIYSLQRPEEVRLLPRTMARLVYDSFREPLLAGVRSQHCVAHQLMYVAGPYCVDLRLEQDRESKHVLVIGQIANRELGAVGVPEIPVFMLSRNSIVAKTVSNKFGEFAMEYKPRSGLRLYAPVPGENQGIEVRLGRASLAGNQDS
jgi:hypothetical protein